MSSDIDDDCEVYAAPKRGVNPIDGRGGSGGLPSGTADLHRAGGGTVTRAEQQAWPESHPGVHFHNDITIQGIHKYWTHCFFTKHTGHLRILFLQFFLY